MGNFLPDKNLRFFFKNGIFWQTALLSAIATAVWRIYYPGLMSNDSVDQFVQASLNSYTDWHPPLMSIILSVFLKLGVGIGGLMLFQCLLAVFGLRNAISLLIFFFSNQTVPKKTCRTLATITTVFFLIPFLSPFMFFSIIFWKDSWLAIMLLWLSCYLLWMFLNFESLSKRKFAVHLFLLALFSAILISLRHNALSMLPVFCVIFALVGKIKYGNKGLAASGVILFLAIVLNPLINVVFNVKPSHTGNLVLANDFAVMLRLYPELQAEFPLASRNRLLPVACHQHDYIYWGINIGKDNNGLRDEYLKALSTRRRELLYTRLYLFGQLLHPNHWRDLKVFYGIEVNTIGLKSNENFAETREILFKLSEDTGNQWYFIWISGLHVVWLVLNFLCAIFFFIKTLIKRDVRSLFLLLLYSIPLSYYCSYILAAVSSDYRYMYPSTLMMQTLIVSALVSGILKLLQKRKFIT